MAVSKPTKQNIVIEKQPFK